MLRHLGDDALDLLRQRAAIGVAQHDPARAGVVRGARALQGVFGVRLVAVEEMLAIDHGLAASGARDLHGLGDAVEIFVERAAQRDMHLIVPALGDIDDVVGGRLEQRGDAGIIGGRAPRPLGHAEGAEARALRRLLLEELRVERIGAGIAAFDIVEAEIVIEHPGDLHLVVEREIDAGRLRAVAQGRVEEVETFAAHADFPVDESCFFIVVLPSHWPAISVVLRICAS
jgi:hypothetical protein